MNNFDVVQLISNVGFPIVISIYLLQKFEKRIESLEKAINQLTEVVKEKGMK